MNGEPPVSPVGSGLSAGQVAASTAGFCAFYLFAHTGLLGEVMALYLNLKAPIIFGYCILISVLVLMRGGVDRFTRLPVCTPWVLLAAWCVLTSFLSFARGPSLSITGPFVIRFMAMPFIICAWARSPQDVNSMLKWTGAGGFVLVALCAFAGGYKDERFEVPGTSMENPNDLAFALLWTSSFQMALLMGKSKIMKIVTACILPVALSFGLKTASRSNFITLAALVAVLLLILPAKARLVTLISVPVLVATIVAALPDNTRTRIFTIVVGSQEDAARASIESTDASLRGTIGSQAERMYLAQLAVDAALRHPVFGTGPGMFADETADYVMRTTGKKAPWLTAHDAYLKIASETGFIGAIFYIWSILAAAALNYRIIRRTVNDSSANLVYRNAVVLLLALTCYAVNTFFCDNIIYYYFLPITVGLSAANALACNLPARRSFGVAATLGSAQPV